MIGGIKIGDGTAPKGWPAYGAKGDGIVCKFNSCGHTGSLGSPAKMNCEGRRCRCSCCRMLAGGKEYGCTYGLPEQDEWLDMKDFEAEQ